MYETFYILTDGLLDPSKYEQYSPPFLTAANLIVYGENFALYPFAIIYCFIADWKAIKKSGD